MVHQPRCAELAADLALGDSFLVAALVGLDEQVQRGRVAFGVFVEDDKAVGLRSERGIQELTSPLLPDGREQGLGGERRGSGRPDVLCNAVGVVDAVVSCGEGVSIDLVGDRSDRFGALGILEAALLDFVGVLVGHMEIGLFPVI